LADEIPIEEYPPTIEWT